MGHNIMVINDSYETVINQNCIHRVVDHWRKWCRPPCGLLALLESYAQVLFECTQRLKVHILMVDETLNCLGLSGHCLGLRGQVHQAGARAKLLFSLPPSQISLIIFYNIKYMSGCLGNVFPRGFMKLTLSVCPQNGWSAARRYPRGNLLNLPRQPRQVKFLMQNQCTPCPRALRHSPDSPDSCLVSMCYEE